MASSKKKKHQGSAASRDAKREKASGSSGKRQESRQPRKGRLSAKRPVIRFVVVLALLMGGFNALFYGLTNEAGQSRAAFFDSYLAANAESAAWIIRRFGGDVTVRGDVLTTKGFSLAIKRGCDAIQASAFFVFLVLASPSRSRLISRIPFIIKGAVFLLLMNLVRILTLYYSGLYMSSVFDFLHVDFWQAVFIFMPLFLWIMWTRKELRGTPAPAANEQT